MIQNNRNKQ